jgi:hypothetical protein
MTPGVAPISEIESIRDPLARHGVRRARGVPTVSVLIGPAGAIDRAWREWATTEGRECVPSTANDGSEIVRTIVRKMATSRDLFADACGWLADQINCRSGDIQAKVSGLTQSDLEQFWDAVSPSLKGSECRLVTRCIVQALANERSMAPDRVAAVLMDASTPGLDPWSTVAGLAGLVPTLALPAVLLTPPANHTTDTWFRLAAKAAAAGVTRAPSLSVGIVVSRGTWARYLADVGESRVKALVREGAVELPLLNAATVEQILASEGMSPNAIPSPIRQLAQAGVTADLVNALIGAVQTKPALENAGADDQANSQQERFLFEFLEMLPETAGRFALNGDPGFRFGPHQAEVDLLAADLCLAIEIDGYYHFQDPHCYRRDRHKDWELQRRGYVVIRFLADDVISRLEDTRDRILEAVAYALNRPKQPLKDAGV